VPSPPRQRRSGAHAPDVSGAARSRQAGANFTLRESASDFRLKFTEGPYQMERMPRCLDLGTMASEDLRSEDGHSSGRLSEAS
jgi:hypothetical protein